jgi:hypothetical protein
MRTAILMFAAFVAGFVFRNWIGRLTFYSARVVKKDDNSKNRAEQS